MDFDRTVNISDKGGKVLSVTLTSLWKIVSIVEIKKDYDDHEPLIEKNSEKDPEEQKNGEKVNDKEVTEDPLKDVRYHFTRLCRLKLIKPTSDFYGSRDC